MDCLTERLRTTGETRRKATPVDDPTQYMNVYARLSREDGALMGEAADEIDRLREALETIRDMPIMTPVEVYIIARDAIGRA